MPQNELKRLDIENIRQAIKDGGCIAVITAGKISVYQKGTRSEQIQCHAELDQTLFGRPDSLFGIRAYTDKGHAPLKAGKKYIVVLSNSPMFNPDYFLDDFVEIEAGKMKETIKFYEKIILELKN